MIAILIIALAATNAFTLRRLAVWRERAWRMLGHAKDALKLNETLLRERDAARFDAEFSETLRNVQAALLQHARD